MKKLLILLFTNFQIANVYSQESYSPIDSTIVSFPLTDSDWVIALTINQPGLFNLDSLGNDIGSNPNGTFIFTKINNRYNLQRLDRSYADAISVLKMGKVIDISGDIRFYTKDSILQAEKEWIYPYIYKNDSLDVYDIQYKGIHAPSFRMFFRIKQTMFFKNFDDIDITASLKWTSTNNINYSYNANTFTYRAFMKLIELLEKNLGIKVLY